jgi:hypothetical protein
MAWVGAVSFLVMGVGAFAAAPAGPSGDYRFIEGGTAQLSGIKRVIITNFVVAFQVDAAVRKDDAKRVGQMTIHGGKAKEVAAKMEWKEIDHALLQEIADAGLAALKADFKAKGIEVLDESVLAGQPAYANILAASGLTNFTDYTIMNINDDAQKVNIMDQERNGLVKVVGAKGLTPYNHSSFEGGTGCYLLGKSFPLNKIYYVPGHEIDLAKALDAVVVKACQFVNFSQVTAGVKQEGFSGGTNVHFDATAKSVVRVREGKTRLSFRLPTSTQRTRNTPTQLDAKDGDVVIALAKPLLIGTEYYNIANSGETGGQKIRASLGGTQHFNFAATLGDPAAYKTAVTQGLDVTLGGLVSAAIGR